LGGTSVYWNGPVSACVAAAVFPRIFRHTRNALVEARGKAHVLAAVARGTHPAAVALRHVVMPVAPRTVALAGVSVAAALGAAVPVEVLADVPGIGQLAWRAASGRDMPLMAGLTLLVTVVTLAANAAADAALASGERA
jgi:peptide/nickel transport system permease protein